MTRKYSFEWLSFQTKEERKNIERAKREAITHVQGNPNRISADFSWKLYRSGKQSEDS